MNLGVLKDFAMDCGGDLVKQKSYRLGVVDQS